MNFEIFFIVYRGLLQGALTLFAAYWMWTPLIVAFLTVKPIVLKINSFFRGGY